MNIIYETFKYEINLLVLVGVFVFLIALFLFIKRKPDTVKWSPYYLRKSLMNDSEKAFYQILKERLGQEYEIMSKVRMEDYVGVKRRGLSFGVISGYRNHIKSRHVDFLICEKITLKPIFAIEVDGPSHDYGKQKERDIDMNRIYDDIGLQYKHIKVGSDFNIYVDELVGLLNQYSVNNKT